MQQSSGALAPVKFSIVLFAAAQAFLQYLAWAEEEEPGLFSTAMVSGCFQIFIQIAYHMYWINKLNENPSQLPNDVLNVGAACIVFGCVLVVSLVVVSEYIDDKPDGLVLVSHGLDALMTVINCSIAFKHGDKIQAHQGVTVATGSLLFLSCLSCFSQLDWEHPLPNLMQFFLSGFQSISGTYACHTLFISDNFECLLRSLSFTTAVAVGTFAQLSHEGLLESDEQAMDLLWWWLHIIHATAFGMVHMVGLSPYIDKISPRNFIDIHKDKLIAPLTALSFGYAVIKNQEPSVFVVKNALCAFSANAALNHWALNAFKEDFTTILLSSKFPHALLGLLSAAPFVPILTDFKGQASDITNDSWAFILAIITSMFVTYAHTLSIGEIKVTFDYFRREGYKISVPALLIALGASVPYVWDLFGFTIDFAGMVGGIAAGLICTGPFLAFICVAVKALVEFLKQQQQANTFDCQSWRQTMGLLYVCSGAATTALQALDDTPLDHPALKMLFLALNAAVNVVGFKDLITSNNKIADKIISGLLGASLLFSTIYTKTQMDADTFYKVSGVVVDAAFSVSLILNYHTSDHNNLKKVSLGVGFISFMVSCGLLEGVASGENDFDQALLLARRLPFMFAGHMGLVRLTEKVYTAIDSGKLCKLDWGSVMSVVLYVLSAGIGVAASPVLIGGEDFNARVLSALVVSSASSSAIASASERFLILWWIVCLIICGFLGVKGDFHVHEKVFGAFALSFMAPIFYDYFNSASQSQPEPASPLCKNIVSSVKTQ